MKQQCTFSAKIILLFGFFIVPNLVYADCSNIGYTVVFINGVSDTEAEARADQDSLANHLGSKFKGESIKTILEYNPKHLDGVGDVVQTASQMFNTPFSNYDLHTILRAMASDVTTRKLLIVGHSQGGLYANEIYDYLVTHGEPASAVGIYAVATPASTVAGGGQYVTSYEDAILSAITLLAQKAGAPLPLPPNIDTYIDSTIPFTALGTHSFVSSYLYSASDRILGDINHELGGLQGGASSSGTCFDAPEVTASDKAQRTLFAVADPTVAAAVTGLTTSYAAAAFAYNTTAAAIGAVGGFVGSIGSTWGSANSNPAAPQNQDKNFEITKKIYGSSLTKEDVDELLQSNNQGAAVALAQIPAPVPTPEKVPPTPTSTPGAVLGEDGPPDTATTAPHTSPAEVPPMVLYVTPNAINTGPPVIPPADDPPPILFDASTTPPVLTVVGCSTNPCLLGNTSAALSWSAPVGAASYGILVNGVQTQTTSQTSVVLTLQDEASTTLAIAAYDASGATSTSNTQTVSVFVPLPVLVLSDSFDAFSTSTWQTFGTGLIQNFMQDDGTGGNCFRGGCAVEGADVNLAPRMYAKASSDLATGSLTIYVRATAGSFFPPSPAITVCPDSGCDSSGATRITFPNMIPIDNSWHEYYIGWRQGATTVESCFLIDDTQAADCTWADTGLPLGSTFDTVALYSGGYRSDLGAHIWVDELDI